ncbi:cytochrome C [Massilia sp. WF1]|uniref:c-type cytochrome n=1 Tax=unclassified Massilia TaxID=2609279 RepID=UPI00064B3D0F|nr:MULTISPECIES: cytochrome c [unclassified Massilia]ALK98897.1 cytochrome C [Massilia sp. WG5]KLU38555.1 cytochrome C [Massilia sp. WF1]
MNKLILALSCTAALTVSASAFAGGDGARGAELAKKYNCASCHGVDYKSPIDPSYPKLAGQHADYLVHALTSYQRGNKGISGRNNPIMAGMAQPLSDQDKADIAAYLQSLPGPLVVRK